MEKLTLLKCGKLFDGLRDEIKDNIEVLILGETIIDLGKDKYSRNIDSVIDLSGEIVTPGLIDAHVHLSTFEWRNRQQEMTYHSQAWKGMAVLYNAERALRRGFTSLRFVGCNCSDGYSSFDAKNLIEKGYFAGSDLTIAPYYTGSIGGMADSSRVYAQNPWLVRKMSDEYPSVGSGRDFFISSVREQVKMGADFIKVMANGGFMSAKGGPKDRQLLTEEYEAIITAAHQTGVPVTAHAYSPETISELVHLGIDGIEHGSLLDEETINLMERNNVYCVPTLMQYDGIIFSDSSSLDTKDEAFRAKLERYAVELKASRELIKDSNLVLGYGSDICDEFPCYECGREYISWVKNGFGALQALKAATSTNTMILGKKNIGTIEAGKRADIAAWPNDLLDNPYAILDCRFVMKKGHIFNTEPCKN